MKEFENIGIRRLFVSMRRAWIDQDMYLFYSIINHIQNRMPENESITVKIVSDFNDVKTFTLKKRLSLNSIVSNIKESL